MISPTTPTGDDLAREMERQLDDHAAVVESRTASDAQMAKADEPLAMFVQKHRRAILTALRSQHNGATQGDKVLRDLLREVRAWVLDENEDPSWDAERILIARIDAALTSASNLSLTIEEE